VTDHGFFEFALGCASGDGKHFVERVEFEEVAMRAARRAWTAVTRAPPTVIAARASIGERCIGSNGFRQAACRGWDVKKYPVIPCAIGRIGVIHDERERLRARGRLTP